MVAMLWATQIIKGKRTYKEVPAGLKVKVAEILIDGGYEHLVTE